MNYWTEQSLMFASQRNYLDELFKVYPISPNLKRELPEEACRNIEDAYNERNNEKLIGLLLDQKVFPIKDSYVAFLREDRTAITRNPQTINRLAGLLYQMGMADIIENCSAPKESNRQNGPAFKRWINNKTLGVPVYDKEVAFMSTTDNAVLNLSDASMKEFAKKNLGYTRNKGLDFVARFNNKYIIGEAKFITANGGHQNSDFADAIATITATLEPNPLKAEIIPIAILDGIIYATKQKKENKFKKYFTKHPEQTILSSLLLREYLYSL